MTVLVLQLVGSSERRSGLFDSYKPNVKFSADMIKGFTGAVVGSGNAAMFLKSSEKVWVDVVCGTVEKISV